MVSGNPAYTAERQGAFHEDIKDCQAESKRGFAGGAHAYPAAGSCDMLKEPVRINVQREEH